MKPLTVLLLTGTALASAALGAAGATPRTATALWLQHGWLADDGWLARNGRPPEAFRSAEALRRLRRRLRAAGITEVFPHLGPTSTDGGASPWDGAQAERFRKALAGVRVLPWLTGGVGKRAFPGDPAWRRTVASSIRGLLRAHPRLAGVQLDLEPIASGDPTLLDVLDDVRSALPAGKILSVAVPPPRFEGVPAWPDHWDETYWRAVASRADQVAVMLYDTGLVEPAAYRDFVARAGRACAASAGKARVLLGLPAYVHGVPGRHDPAVESLANALPPADELLGKRPSGLEGIAVFCEWEMSEGDWRALEVRKAAAPRRAVRGRRPGAPRRGPRP